MPAHKRGESCGFHSTVAALLAGASLAHAAPAALADLAKPPADAQQFTIMSTSPVSTDIPSAGPALDGVRHGRESLDLRGQIFESDSDARMGPDGMIQHLVIRGFSPQGDQVETFDVDNGVAHWRSQIDGGQAAYSGPAMYSTVGGPTDVNALLLDALIAAPGHHLAMLPGGAADAQPLTTLTIGDGARRKTIKAWAITGFSGTPVPVWTDESGKFFAIDQGLTWIPAGYEFAQAAIDKAQTEASVRALPGPSPTLCSSRPQDRWPSPMCAASSTATCYAEDETVVADRGVITVVGPAATTTRFRPARG